MEVGREGSQGVSGMLGGLSVLELLIPAIKMTAEDERTSVVKESHQASNASKTKSSSSRIAACWAFLLAPFKWIQHKIKAGLDVD